MRIRVRQATRTNRAITTTTMVRAAIRWDPQACMTQWAQCRLLRPLLLHNDRSACAPHSNIINCALWNPISNWITIRTPKISNSCHRRPVCPNACSKYGSRMHGPNTDAIRPIRIQTRTRRRRQCNTATGHHRRRHCHLSHCAHACNSRRATVAVSVVACCSRRQARHQPTWHCRSMTWTCWTTININTIIVICSSSRSTITTVRPIRHHWMIWIWFAMTWKTRSTKTTMIMMMMKTTTTTSTTTTTMPPTIWLTIWTTTTSSVATRKITY